MDFIHSRLQITELINMVFEFASFEFPHLVELQEKIISKVKTEKDLKVLPIQLKQKYLKRGLHKNIKYFFILRLLEKYGIHYHISEYDNSIMYYNFDDLNLQNIIRFNVELDRYFTYKASNLYRDVGGVRLISYKITTYF